MFWSHGAPYFRYSGIRWDGRNKAGVGMYHQSDTVYETHIIHEHEQFIGFTLAAVTTSLDMPDYQGMSPLATSEVYFHNLIIEQAPIGVLINFFNAYDNAL